MSDKKVTNLSNEPEGAAQVELNDSSTSNQDTTKLAAQAPVERPAARRALFSLGLPAAAALLATACGKAVFGGDQKRIKKSDPNSGDGSGAAASPTPKPGATTGGQNSAGGENGNAGNGNAGDNTPTDGNNNPLVNDNMTGGNAANGNAANGNTGANNGGTGVTTLDPCDGVGISIIETAAITSDQSIINTAAGTSGGLKIWGRLTNAMVVVALNKDTVENSTVLLTTPAAAASTQAIVLASRLVVKAEVDAKSDTSMIIFDNLNFSTLTLADPDLVVVVLAPDNGAKKAVFSGKVKAYQEKSKRYAHTFKDKRVLDVQVGFQPPEDVPFTDDQKLAFTDKAPTFGESTNGFGHDTADTKEALRAAAIRTAGYAKGGVGDTAHITHAKTNWQFPSKFKGTGVFVTDLLERDVNPKFTGSTTTALKDDHTFVVYIPDNATTPTLYYRYMITVG